MNKAQTFYFAGQILALDFAPHKGEWVAWQMESKNVNWKGLVKLASDHLILPAAYLKLKKHNLTPFLPSDLNDYLAEILELNRERNRSILSQAKWLNNRLSKEGITPVFMKGVANMLDGLYDEPAERMVYDIDILVDEDKMLVAAELLHKEGFITQKKFLKHSIKSAMHYPILLREDMVAGIEVHCRPAQYLYTQYFTNNMLMAGKDSSRLYPGICVLSHRHRVIHNFLHSQLMHNAHYHGDVGLRDLFDLLLLGKGVNLMDILQQYGHYRKESMAYAQLMYKTFDLELPAQLMKESPGRSLLKRHARVLKMHSKQLKRYHFLIMIIQKYLVLPGRMITSAGARNYVFSRIFNAGWYSNHFRLMKKALKRI